jgi:hypothetical protein
MVEQADGARAVALGQARQGGAQRRGVEGVEHEHHEIAAWIGERAGVRVDQPHVAASDVEPAQLLEVLLGGLLQRCGDLDADDALEGCAHRQEHGAPQAAADVDERGAPDHLVRQARDQRVEIGDRHGFVMRRVRRRFADIFGVELAQEEHGFGHDAVLRVEPAPRESIAHPAILA